MTDDVIDLEARSLIDAPAWMKATHRTVTHYATVRDIPFRDEPRLLAGRVCRLDGKYFQILGVQIMANGSAVGLGLRRLLKIGRDE